MVSFRMTWKFHSATWLKYIDKIFHAVSAHIGFKCSHKKILGFATEKNRLKYKLSTKMRVTYIQWRTKNLLIIFIFSGIFQHVLYTGSLFISNTNSCWYWFWNIFSSLFAFMEWNQYCCTVNRQTHAQIKLINYLIWHRSRSSNMKIMDLFILDLSSIHII